MTDIFSKLNISSGAEALKYLFLGFCTLLVILSASSQLVSVLALGPTQGGSTQGGTTQGGDTQGGDTQGGSTQGGSTQGGSTQGGSTQGGSTQGGSTQGGSTQGGDTNQPEPTQAPAPTNPPTGGTNQPPALTAPSISGNCPQPGNRATVTWTSVAGATGYNVRVDGPGVSGVSNSCGPHAVCMNNVGGNSVSFNAQPGASYTTWVAAYNGTNEGPISNHATFTCVAASQPTATPVQQRVEACGVTASQMAPGYENHPRNPSQCAAGQYLFAENQGGYLVTACRLIPAGHVRNASGCGFVAQQVTAPTATPTQAPQGTSTVTLCPGTSQAKTGVVAPGYENHPRNPSQCAAHQYLSTNLSGGYLTMACVNMPAGATRTEGGCAYALAGATATPTPTGTLTATPTGTQNCPAGQVLTMQNSVMVCVNVVAQGGNANATATGGSVTIINPTSAPAQGTALAAAPNKGFQVAGVSTDVKQLPKTGLPIAAWLLSGLLPVGIGMRKLTGKDSEANESSPTYLWQKRQFLKD